MGFEIDPYRTWLGIKSDVRPPNHYDLLGVDQFEDRKDVIVGASIQRSDLLQDIASGNEHIELSQRILNEVAAARLCLLDAEQRKRYELFVKKRSAGLGVAEERLSKTGQRKRAVETDNHTEFPKAESRNVDRDEKASVVRSSSSSRASKVPKRPQSKMRRTKGAKGDNRWLIPVAAGILVFAVLASVVIAVAIIMNAGESNALVDANGAAVAGQRVANESGNSKTVRTKRAAKKKPINQSQNDGQKDSREGASRDDPERDGLEADRREQAVVNQAVAVAAPPEADSSKPENVLASYDASAGNPRSSAQVPSPDVQGWAMLNDSPGKTRPVLEKYSQPAWNVVANEGEIGVGAELNLSDEDFDAMWNQGWRLEVIARVEKGTGLIGFGFPTSSGPFLGNKESQILLIYSAAKGDYRIRQGWQDEQLTIKNGINSRRFTKIVLESAAKSYEMKMTVAQLSGKLDKQRDVKELTKPFSKSSPFVQKVGWLARTPENDSALEASLIVRKIQLSLLDSK